MEHKKKGGENDMTDKEAIRVLKQMRKDTPTMPYDCLMNEEMEALDCILLNYEMLCEELKKIQGKKERITTRFTKQDLKTLKKVKKICEKTECTNCIFSTEKSCILQAQANWWRLDLINGINSILDFEK